MIVDTSALVAIVQREPQAGELVGKLDASPISGIGTPTLVELGIVLSNILTIDPRGLIAKLVDDFDLVEITFGPDHWREALEAHRRYGRGRHPAQLNLGDCMTYAVARLANEPLLYVGTDFAATDLSSA